MSARTLALAAILLTGCRDSLAPGDYRGTPRIHLGGIIKGDPGYAATLVRPRMAVLWSSPGGAIADTTGSFTSAVSTTFPTQYELDLYDAPDPAPGAIEGGSPEALLGFGRLVAVDDVDGNGAFTVSRGALVAPDRFIGAAPKHMVIYADNVGTPDRALRRLIANPERLVAGYQLGRGLCGQDGEADRLELVDASASVSVELVMASSTFPTVAGCLRLAP